ncbi:MAG: DUF1638 domain-containing protein [Desulfotignum sp.]
MKLDIPDSTKVIACKVFQPEIDALGVDKDRVVYLDQSLHRYPDMLNQAVQEALRELEDIRSIDTVILLFGFCGGGLSGISSHRLKLIVPRVHDCIPLLLSEVCQEKDCREVNHAFYLSPGWIDHGETPYTEFFKSSARYGREDALWIAGEMLKGYKEIVLIEALAPVRPHHRIYAKKMANLFHLGYREVKTSGSWLTGLLSEEQDCLKYKRVLAPKEMICKEIYPLS